MVRSPRLFAVLAVGLSCGLLMPAVASAATARATSPPTISFGHRGVAAAGAASAATAKHARPIATASLTCHGISCHGHDPYLYGCTASSHKSAYFYLTGTWVATVTNYYSIKCNANWTQAWLSSNAVYGGWNFGITLTTYDSQSPPQLESMCWSGPNSPNNTGGISEPCIPQVPPYYNGTGPAWTDMVDGTNLTFSGMSVDDAFGDVMDRFGVDQ
jgi:hypothetical protein